MVNTPTPKTPKVSPKQRLTKAAFVIGLTGLVFVWVPFVGIVLGLIALILALIARKKTPKSAQPPSRTGLTLSIIALVGGVVLLLGYALIYLLGVAIFGPTAESAPAREAGQAQIAEKKDFSVGEVAHIGDKDVAITNVVRNYEPTAIEFNKYPQDHFSDDYRDELRKQDKYSDEYYNSELTDDNDEYVLVEGTVQSNGKTPAIEDVSDDIELNHYPLYYYTGDGFLAGSRTESTKGTFRAVFRIKKDSSHLVLYYREGIFTSTSRIFGSEGAPRADLSYTIQLN